MPKDPIDVVLNYGPATGTAHFGPTPRQVAVGPNDTIQFRISDSTKALHPDGKLKITIHKGQHFSKALLQHSKDQTGVEPLTVKVQAGSLADLVAASTNNIITGYKCELVDENGVTIGNLSSDGSDGGEIVPDSGAD